MKITSQSFYDIELNFRLFYNFDDNTLNDAVEKQHTILRLKIGSIR